ncbi:hypothetical protein CONPUDRAFT_144793 [Coniophora puteana RWD-64-598 SS2]|uniref:DUF6533 domain-containing protein n=1 Tax=Coniophora puteana (strain RWD-64-598) TaxID=741705 RepID=A0A5M3MLI4_CONPW|nr:uncharacterized protein CONPUDRAFT_144793 [Coniophora puteana RWD-64-598 SS2]EIW79535.1 hypothetical protein CONPUDRAFT_144793 [Coniophora puteana RWD-64-598 SS2]
MASDVSPVDLPYIEAAYRGSQLFMASLSLACYDHIITLDQEVEYFWSRSWNISSVIYILIRYTVLLCVILVTIVSMGGIASSERCLHLDKALIGISIVNTLIGQAAITLRVWYLFRRNNVVQAILVALYIACAATTAAATLRNSNISSAVTSNSAVTADACGMTLSKSLYLDFLSALILHVILYCFTIWLFVASVERKGLVPLAKRFVKEGAPMYLVATAVLLYTIIGTSMKDPWNYIPAYQSFLYQSLITVAICHALLSVRSLAARLNVDASWLLSNSELSRINYRRGTNEGEILVDYDAHDGVEMQRPSSASLARFLRCLLYGSS